MGLVAIIASSCSASSRAQEEGCPEISPASSVLDGWYAVAADASALKLLDRKIMPDAQRPGLIAQTEVTERLLTYDRALRKSGALLRLYPTTSFVVLHNAGSKSLHSVTVNEIKGSSRSLLARFSTALPNEYLFIPYDFIEENEARTDPRLPDAVILSCDEGCEREIVASDTRVSWLGTDFIRAMLRTKKSH